VFVGPRRPAGGIGLHLIGAALEVADREVPRGEDAGRARGGGAPMLLDVLAGGEADPVRLAELEDDGGVALAQAIDPVVRALTDVDGVASARPNMAGDARNEGGFGGVDRGQVDGHGRAGLVTAHPPSIPASRRKLDVVEDRAYRVCIARFRAASRRRIPMSIFPSHRSAR
jgi:hypothetical protein